MKTSISQKQIDKYRRDGALILGEFLTANELENVRRAVTTSVEQMGKQKVAGEGKDMVEGDDYYDRIFVQRLNLWRIDDTIRKYFLSSAIGEMLCKLEGIDGLRVWHDQTLQKQPWANPTNWHVDDPSWSFTSNHAISIWVALDDATIQNGCMYYLPGSHNIISKYENPPKGGGTLDISSIFEPFPELREINPIVAPMKAGMAAVHNGLTAHAAGPNMSPGWRRAMTCAYMPDGSTFNGIQNILSDKTIARLNIGDSLDDESQNPLVWSRPTA